MNRLLSILLLVVLSAVLPPAAEAQQWPSMTISDGLSGMSVFRVCKDRHGQVWIGTSNGVTLFDGGRMVYSFTLDDEHHTPVACNDLVVTADDRVVVATAKGIWQLNTRDERFDRLMTDLSCGEALLALGDTLYVGGADGLAVSTDGGRSTRMLLKPALNSMDNSVRCLRQGPDGAVWFTTSHCLNRLDVASGRIDTVVTVSDAALSRFDFAAGRIFIGTKNNGLLVADGQTGHTQPLTGIDKIVSDVTAGSNGQVLVATDGDGAFVIDAATQTVVCRYNTNEPMPRQLPSNAVYCFSQDGQGTLWAGFYNNGVSYQSRSECLLETFTYGDFTTAGHNVTAMLDDGDNLLIGTNKAVYLLNTVTGRLDSYTAEQTGRTIVKQIVRYRDRYYICYYDGGVKCIDIATRQLQGPPVDHPSFHNGTFSTAVVSPSDQLWLSNDEGVWVVDSTGHYVNYNEQNSRIYGNPAISIEFNKQGNAYLTFTDGLVLYAAANNSFAPRAWPGKAAGMGGMTIRRMDDDHYALFGQNHLFVSDESIERIQPVTLPKSILKERCIDVADDQQGHYWIATESGLFRTDYEGSVLQQIPLGQGLTGTQVNRLYTDSSQRLWLLTQKGLLVCRLDGLKELEQQASAQINMLLHDVFIGDERMTVDALLSANRDRQLPLPWNLWSAVLRLHVTDSDPQGTSARFYEYAVDDGPMTLVSTDDELLIDGLSPGTHRLTLRLAGLPDTQQTFTLTVRPTTLFYAELLLVVLLVAALFAWWRYRRRTRSIIAEHVETEQALIEENKVQWEEEQQARQEKYARVRYDEEELKRIYEQMNGYMERERPYLNPDFRLKDIAQALEVQPGTLSQVFTLYAKESYYDYINRYRLEAFKQTIAEGRHHQFTINALSEQCGFKRSSFFSTFRRVEGITPYEYIKKRA